ncbi:transposase family protein [Streptomyces sp. UC4497]
MRTGSTRGFACLSTAGIDLSTPTLRFLAGRLRTRHRLQGTRCRRLPPGRRALLVLAHLRKGDTYAQLAAGFGIGTATAYRYIREAIEILATLAPTLEQASEAARRKAFLILDGTLLPIDRIAAGRPYCSGKAKRHGMNVQVIADPPGKLLWASPALPGATHDLTAARTTGIIDALAMTGLTTWAGRACQAAGRHIRVPIRGRKLKRWQRRHNTTHAKIRCVGEQAVATLKGWPVLRKIRCSTNRTTDLVRAILTLHLARSEGR